MNKIWSLLLALTLVSMTAVLAFAATNNFSDVDPNAFYADAANSVAQKGLITGYKDGRFGPNDPVTRGQLAVVLERFESYLDKKYVAKEGDAVKPTPTEEPKEEVTNSTTPISNKSFDDLTVSSGNVQKTGFYYKLGTGDEDRTDLLQECKDSFYKQKSGVVYFDYKNLTGKGLDADIRVYYGPHYLFVADGGHYFYDKEEARKGFEVGIGECLGSAIIEVYNTKDGKLLDRFFVQDPKIQADASTLPKFEDGEIMLNSGLYYVLGDGTITPSKQSCDKDSSENKATVLYFDVMNNEDGGMEINYKYMFGMNYDHAGTGSNYHYSREAIREAYKLGENQCYGSAKIELSADGRVMDTYEVKAAN